MLWSTMPLLQGRGRSRLIAVSDVAVSNRAFSCGTDVCVRREKREGKRPGEWVPGTAVGLGVSHPPALQLCVGCGREGF